MTGQVTIELRDLAPAAEHGWHVLLDLAEANASWMLIGGQLSYLLAREHGTELPRPTDDVDVVMDVRAQQGGTEWLAGWLLDRGFSLDGVSPTDVGHRFVRDADPGPGRVLVDVLAPEGLGERTNVYTVRPARTVQAPGSVFALGRVEVVRVAVVGVAGTREGAVRRPDLLGALVLKAAATALPVRRNPERDLADAALLLSLVGNPLETVRAATPRELAWCQGCGRCWQPRTPRGSLSAVTTPCVAAMHWRCSSHQRPRGRPRHTKAKPGVHTAHAAS